MNKLFDRKNLDYWNFIKEFIFVVELIVKVILGNKKDILGNVFINIKNIVGFYNVFERGFK